VRRRIVHRQGERRGRNKGFILQAEYSFSSPRWFFWKKDSDAAPTTFDAAGLSAHGKRKIDHSS